MLAALGRLAHRRRRLIITLWSALLVLGFGQKKFVIDTQEVPTSRAASPTLTSHRSITCAGPRFRSATRSSF